MLIGLKEILEIAEERNCAIPAFNVYNFEMAYGVMEAMIRESFWLQQFLKWHALLVFRQLYT